MASNTAFDISAEGVAGLTQAVHLAFSLTDRNGTRRNGTKGGVTHYAVREAKEGHKEPTGAWSYGREPRPLRLVFFDHYELKSAGDDKVALPFNLDAEGAADFARRWLEEADYGREPDIDGHCKKGWRVYNERYGRIDGDWNSVVAIAPSWAEYGK